VVGAFLTDLPDLHPLLLKGSFPWRDFSRVLKASQRGRRLLDGNSNHLGA
jgi:hypothetical protein